MYIIDWLNYHIFGKKSKSIEPLLDKYRKKREDEERKKALFFMTKQLNNEKT